MVTKGQISHQTYDKLAGVIMVSVVILVAWAIVFPTGPYASLFGGRWIAVILTPIIGLAMIVAVYCFVKKTEKTINGVVTGKFAAVEKGGRNYLSFQLEEGEEERIFVEKKSLFENINIGDYGQLAMERYEGKEDWKLTGFSIQMIPEGSEMVISCASCGGNNVIANNSMMQCVYCGSGLSRF